MARRYNDDHDDDDDDKPRLRRLAKTPSPQLRRAWEEDDEEETEEQIQAARQRCFARRRYEEEEEKYDEEDEEEDKIEIEQDLFDILELIDHTRKSLHRHSMTLLNLLDTHPELREKWRRFVQSGGVTANDFGKYLDGDLRPRITRQHRHLRLISSRKVVPLKLNRNGNDDAA